METGFRDPDAKDREMSVKCIVGMRAQASIFIQDLLTHFSSDNPGVRTCAVEALAQLGRHMAEPHVALLLNALRDQEWKVRLAAVEAIRR